MIKSFNEFNSTNESFVDWLSGNTETGELQKAGINDGSLDKVVEDFYSTLDQFAKSGKTITVQSTGNYIYSKLVEDIQLSLMFLGYNLTKHGVDGYFGPETAAAIIKFNDDTAAIQNEGKLVSFYRFISEAANGRLDTTELETVIGAGTPTDSDNKLNDIAAKAYREMETAAESAGITWEITDSYRNYDDQVSVAGKKGLYGKGGLAAVPGKSNHGWGSALDLKLDSKAQAWLNTNASKYGFSTIPGEPWHWEHKASVEFAKTGKEDPNAGKSTSVIIDADLIDRIIKKLKEKNFSQIDLDKYQSTNINTVNLTSAKDEEFYKAILKSLGVNETPEKIKFLKAWRQGEGGKALNNPFNTTKDIPGDADTKYNSVGVRNYPDRQTGLDATIKTLQLPQYKSLIELLKKDTITATELANSSALTTWGSGDMVKKVLVGGHINPPAIQSA